MPDGAVQVRLFGALHALRRERGLPAVAEVPLSEEGLTGVELAEILELPLDLVEGLFRNHTVHPVTHRVFPGDEVAFVPKGTPGPHRYFLGLYRAGQESAEPGHKPE